MKNGTVKFFNANKGFGFIIDDESESDLFFHIKQVVGGKTLKEGERVQYNIKDDKKGPIAIDIETL